MKLTQEEVCAKANITTFYLSKLENGKTDVITNITLERLANALNKKVVDFPNREQL